MIITILSLFPEIFSPVFNSSILKRAQNKKLVKFQYVNIRDFATDKHRTVDDRPYGGGPGMIMRVDILEKAIQKVKIKNKPPDFCEKVVLLDPKGKIFSQAVARKYARLDHLVLVCGHYEGVDERIKYFVDEIISIGKYILTGGEIPAMVIADSVVRLLPGVLEKKEALEFESFRKKGYLEYPQYTRPRIYKGYSVPPVLLSGNHQKITEWRKNY